MRKEFHQNAYSTESRCIIGPENMLFAGKGPENILFAGKGPDNILFAGTSLLLSGRKVYRQEQ